MELFLTVAGIIFIVLFIGDQFTEHRKYKVEMARAKAGMIYLNTDTDLRVR